MNTASPTKRLVLVHGASHGGWCWELVAPLLKAQGFDVDTPDLPGSGNDMMPPRDVTLAAYVKHIVATIEAKPGPVVLVGHSLGGLSITEVAEVIPDRIARLVYLAAGLPQQGDSGHTMMDRLIVADEPSAGRGWRESTVEGAHEIMPELATDIFYHMCDAETARLAVARLRPQASAPMAVPLKFTDARWGRVPKTYIVCTQDRAAPVRIQRWMSTRTPGVKVIEMETDHSPFYSDAPGLAKILEAECR